MKVRYIEEVANHSGPKRCGGTREGATEALSGETDRPGVEPRNQESGMPTLLSDVEGNTEQGAHRKSCNELREGRVPLALIDQDMGILEIVETARRAARDRVAVAITLRFQPLERGWREFVSQSTHFHVHDHNRPEDEQ